MKKLFSILIILFSFLLIPLIAYASTQLGGMDLNGWCAHINQGTAVLSSSTWECSSNNQPIDFVSQPAQNCVWQYNISDSFAQQITSGNPYSWACFTNSITP